MPDQGTKRLPDRDLVDLTRGRRLLWLPLTREVYPLLCGGSRATDPTLHRRMYDAIVGRFLPQVVTGEITFSYREGSREGRTFVELVIV